MHFPVEPSVRFGLFFFFFFYFYRFLLAWCYDQASVTLATRTVFLTSAHENWLVLLVGASRRNSYGKNVIFGFSSAAKTSLQLFSLSLFIAMSVQTRPCLRDDGEGRLENYCYLFLPPSSSSSLEKEKKKGEPREKNKTRNADRNRSDAGLIYPERGGMFWYHPPVSKTEPAGPHRGRGGVQEGGRIEPKTMRLYKKEKKKEKSYSCRFTRRFHVPYLQRRSFKSPFILSGHAVEPTGRG